MGQERMPEQRVVRLGTEAAEVYANSGTLELNGIYEANTVQLLKRREKYAIPTGHLTVQREIPAFGS